VGNVEVSLHYFLQEDVERILNYCDRHDVTAMVVGMHSIAAYRLKPVIAEVFGKGLGLGDFHFDKLDDVLHEPILQITPFLSPEQEAELMPSLKAVNSGRWTDAFTDLTHCDADKGKGLEAMAAYLNISLEQTMAFGDGGNDVSILRKAGVGVAMGNARDGVKAQADYVTTSVDDDGVRNALRHFGIVDCPTV
jgi:Cof subfamily protein (haloacid dehalogenase superfamily)